MDQVIKNDQLTLPYHVYGHGSRPLLAFHGFGRTGNDFHIFEKGLGAHYTIYAFDLPYHGQGKVNESVKNPAFTKQDLKALITQFCNEKKISRFSVMGYSLGGKIALGCVEVFKEQVENIYLLAPDGLKINPFYFFGTRTWLGRWLFESIIDHPGPLFGLGNFLEKMKWINPRLNHFVKHQMDTADRRRQVFHVWVLFRKFIPDLKMISESINKNNTTLLMFFGKYDTVIPARLSGKILPRLKNKKEVLHVLDCGHRVMEKSDVIVQKILRS